MAVDFRGHAKIEGAKTTALYTPLQATLKHDAVELRRDQVYGPHERHRADVFLPKKSGTALLADAADPGAAAHAGQQRLPNHLHLSEAYAVGTADQLLTYPILKFIEALPK